MSIRNGGTSRTLTYTEINSTTSRMVAALAFAYSALNLVRPEGFEPPKCLIRSEMPCPLDYGRI